MYTRLLSAVCKMINCGMCGRPTKNPQGICELCIKSKNRVQKREQRRDEREIKAKTFDQQDVGTEEEEEDASAVWVDEKKTK